MSGLFAAIVRRDDGGIRYDNDRVLQRAQARGRDALITTFIPLDGIRHGIPDDFANKRLVLSRQISTTECNSYAFLGCAFTRPAAGGDTQVFRHKTLYVAIDGTIARCDGTDVAKLLFSGFANVAKLSGQYALVAFDTGSPDRLYWAARAKPLFALWNGSFLRIASRKEDFHGFYHSIRSPQPVPLGPFAYGWLNTEGIPQVKSFDDRDSGRGSLILSGGGLDTLVASWDNQQEYPLERTLLLYVDYGAKAASREWGATKRIAEALGSRYLEAEVEARRVGFDVLQLTHSSLLTKGESVSKSPIAGLATEWVPARNTLLMSMALSLAESDQFARIVCGINQEAAIAYPDNEEEWLERWRALVPYALNVNQHVELSAPLAAMSKTDIVKRGEKLGIPWQLARSWSCYEGGGVHCGRCSSCRSRRLAFKQSRVKDPTEYEAEVS